MFSAKKDYCLWFKEIESSGSFCRDRRFCDYIVEANQVSVYRKFSVGSMLFIEKFVCFHLTICNN